ncbi:MAG: DUF3800 domain-containing protein [Pseudomonadota bacterium]
MSTDENIESTEKESLPDPKKLAKIEKEKKELLAALAGGDFSTQRTKVAAVLNLFPDSRNSDITLALKYWETFQPDTYNPDGIKPKDLFKLERLHYIVRARAKIQNEYGLFLADEKIKHRRKQQEEVMHDAVLEDVKPKRVVHVFSDETGKNSNFVIVASVWVLSGRAIFTVSEAIKKWKETSVWANREVHFSRFGKMDFEPLRKYLGVIHQNREFLSFKVIAVEKSRTSRKIEEVIAKLHEHMLIRGAEHEIQQGRMELPREVGMTLDEEQSLDPFTLSEIKRKITDEFTRNYNGELALDTIQTVSSRASALVQLADLVAGAVHRRLNHSGEQNYKDEMADCVIHTLDLSLSEEGIPGLDASALFRV